MGNNLEGLGQVSRRRTNPWFLSDGEVERERRRLEFMVRGITQAKHPDNQTFITKTDSAVYNKDLVDSSFWHTNKCLIVRAIVLGRAYDKTAILRVTGLSDECYQKAETELMDAHLLMRRENRRLLVTRELYWQCLNYFRNKNSEQTNQPTQKPIAQEQQPDDHISRKDFLFGFFGFFSRDFGNPERHFIDNPQEIIQFICDCARNKLPAFISVQPMKAKAQPLGLEKVFFDFDYCKKSEALTQTEIRKRYEELDYEVRHFLQHLEQLSIKPLIIKTRRGFHVHVFFDSVYEIDNQTKFWKQVYRSLQHELMQGYDYRYIDVAVLGDINRMCRIPLSIHEKSGQECIIVDNQLRSDKVRSIEFFKLYGLKQKDISAAMKKVREEEKALKLKPVAYVTRTLTFENQSGIRPCFVKALESGEMCHRQRLALLSEAYSLGFHSPESIIELYRGLNDFDYSTTQYQVEWFLTHWVPKGGIVPYGCRTIQKCGWCIGNECTYAKKYV